MSGPLETAGIIIFAGIAFCVAIFVVPIAKPKPEQAPRPPAYERLADRPEKHDEVSQAAPVVAPAPPPPLETEDERLMVLEQSVNEIKRDQQELKGEIRALTKELKAK